MAHPIRWMLALAFGALSLGALATTALAGGDDYDAANDKEREGPVYFGFVRDANGAVLAVGNRWRYDLDHYHGCAGGPGRW